MWPQISMFLGVIVGAIIGNIAVLAWMDRKSGPRAKRDSIESQRIARAAERIAHIEIVDREVKRRQAQRQAEGRNGTYGLYDDMKYIKQRYAELGAGEAERYPGLN